MNESSLVTWLVAAFAGALLGSLYLGVLWQSAYATVRSRSLLPWAFGMTVRFALLIGAGALLVAAGSGPLITLFSLAGFMAIRWIVFATSLRQVSPSRKGRS